MIATKAFTLLDLEDERVGRDELNRWYKPSCGTWLSEDPIGFEAGDSNLYRYVGNSATNATDPSGLVDKWFWWYYNANGKTLNLDTEPGFKGLYNVLNGSEQVATANKSIEERAVQFALNDAKSPLRPDRSGETRFREIDGTALVENPEFAGNQVQTVIGGLIEIAIFGHGRGNKGDLGDTDATTLYALGGSGGDGGVRGTGTLKWKTGKCVLHEGTPGIFITVSGSLNVEFRDEFVDAADAVDKIRGNQEWSGGVAYDIRAKLTPIPVARRYFARGIVF